MEDYRDDSQFEDISQNEPSKIQYSITCTNVPESLFDSDAATQHFGKFGTLSKIILAPKKQSCIVLYESKASGERAILNGGAYDGFMFDVTWTKRTKKRSKANDDPDWLPDSEVAAELAAMMPENTKIPRLNRQQKMEIEKPMMRNEKPVSRKTPAMEAVIRKAQMKKNAKEQMKQPSAPAPPAAAFPGKSLDKEELRQLVSRAYTTEEEKLKALEMRDRVIRARLSVRRGALAGCCPDMCPERERLVRHFQRQVAVYEFSESGSTQMDPKRAVKQYSRSSADQEEPLEHDLRPVPVLRKTMVYLLHHIMELSEKDDSSLEDWFHFMWDRLRSIRKDITQQALCCEGSISLVEACARFHAHCAARLVEEPPSSFDQRLNTENLSKCLQSLKYMYGDLRARGEGAACQREPEFRAYVILLNLHDSNFMWEVQKLVPAVQQSPEIRFAIKVFTALDNNNYIKFFKLVKETTYLNACILQRYFSGVRARALKRMIKSYSFKGLSQFPSGELQQMLGFESVDAMEPFLEHYGLQLSADSEPFVILDKNAFSDNDNPYTEERAFQLIESKIIFSLGKTVYGEDLPPSDFEQYAPHVSFDASGYLKKSAILAEDQGYKPSAKAVEEVNSVLKGDNFSAPKKIETSKQNPPSEQIFGNMGSKTSAIPVMQKKNPDFTFAKPQTINVVQNVFGQNKSAMPTDVFSSKASAGDNVFQKSSGSESLFKTTHPLPNIENKFVFSKPATNEGSDWGNQGQTSNIFNKAATKVGTVSKPSSDVFGGNASQSTNIFALPKTENPPSNTFDAKSSVFGSSQTSSNVNIFSKTSNENSGPPQSTGGVFSSKPTKSIFGDAGSAVPKDEQKSVPVFGSTKTVPPVFGGATQSAPIFGNVAPSATPVFGNALQPARIFGSTKPEAPIFGNTPVVSSAVPAPSVFGNATPASSVFGSTNQAKSVFEKNTQASSVFGKSTEASSVFGNSTAAASVFGNTTKATSVFGKTTEASSVFGKTSEASSVFGKTTEASSVFGKTTEASLVFGNSAPAAPVFGNTTQASSVFGNAPQSSVFGNATPAAAVFKNAGQGSTVFGNSKAQVPVFGSSLQAIPIFGNAKPDVPAFEGSTLKSSVFGNTAPALENSKSTLPVFGSSGDNENLFVINKAEEEEKRKLEEANRLKREEEERSYKERVQEEKRKQEELKKKLEEEKKALELEKIKRAEEERKKAAELAKKKLEQEKREAEERKIKFENDMDQKSKLLVPEIVNEIIYEQCKCLMEQEMKQLEDITDLAEIIANEIIVELCKKQCELEVKTEQKLYGIRSRIITRRAFRTWRKQVAKTIRRRSLLFTTPTWIPSRTTSPRDIPQHALQRMRDFHRGKLLSVVIPQKKHHRTIDLFETVKKSLFRRSQDLEKNLCSLNINWKIVTSMPDANESEENAKYFESWIKEVFSINFSKQPYHPVIYLNEHYWYKKFALSVCNVSGCDAFDIENAMAGTNGLVFYGNCTDILLPHLVKRIEVTIMTSRDFERIPVALILTSDKSEHLLFLENKILQFKHQQMIYDYKIWRVNDFSEDSITTSTVEALKWLAKRLPNKPALELNLFHSFLNQCIGDELWYRFKLTLHSSIREVFQDCKSVIDLYNEAIDRTTQMIGNPDLTKYSSFPSEFKEFISTDDIFPKEFEKFPNGWETSNTVLANVMKSFKMPHYTGEWPPRSNETFHKSITNFVMSLKWFSNPGDVALKVYATLNEECVIVGDFNESQCSWLNIMCVLVSERIKEVVNSLKSTLKMCSSQNPVVVVYKKKELNTHRTSPWWYKSNVTRNFIPVLEDYADDSCSDLDLSAFKKPRLDDSVDEKMPDELWMNTILSKLDESIKMNNSCTKMMSDLEKRLEMETRRQNNLESFVQSILEDS